jgi:hypothetical protein
MLQNRGVPADKAADLADASSMHQLAVESITLNDNPSAEPHNKGQTVAGKLAKRATATTRTHYC